MSKTASVDWWDQNSDYHTARENQAEGEVSKYLLPALQHHMPRLERPISVADFACGGGAIADYVLKQCESNGIAVGRCLLIDVAVDNLIAATARLKSRFPNVQIDAHVSNGGDFLSYQKEKVDVLYCWDAMVHFDLLDVCTYIRSLGKVLDGVGIFHHSNLTNITSDIRVNPHWRNFNSKDIFAQIATSSGHTILSQTPVDWEIPELDYLTVLNCTGA